MRHVCVTLIVVERSIWQVIITIIITALTIIIITITCIIIINNET